MINLNDMEKSKKENDNLVPFDMTTVDGNAFSLMHGFQLAARKVEWSAEEIGAVLMECRYGTYDHLVQTILRFTA